MDDLLDSLLTEEEEDALDEICDDDDKEVDCDLKFTLLDEILAMVLGSQPSEDESDYSLENIYQEHQEIKLEWLSYFGRLPPPSSLNNNDNNTDQVEIQMNESDEDVIPLKEQQTIVPDCWEDEVDDIVQDLSLTHVNDKKDVVDNVKKGFRPGGKIPNL